MIGTLECVVLDCPDPVALAEFYAALLGGEVDRADRRWRLDDHWSTLHLDTGMVIAFQRVDDYLPPAWPDPRRPQQFHLDIGVEDVEAAEAQVLALGATLLDPGGAQREWRVYADPVGHPFCFV